VVVASRLEPAPVPGADGMGDQLERLRWFELPDVCLTRASSPGGQPVLPGGVV